MSLADPPAAPAPDPLAPDPLARDPDVVQRQASDPLTSVWVAASAGSGKTKVLTDRVLRQLLAATPPARILCLTFTKAAAAEMANRINRTLSLWATTGDGDLEDRLFHLTGERPGAETVRAARRLFARVIDCPGGMKLLTIHAFCQSLLRRFPLEAGLAPHFEVMDEATADDLLGQAEGIVLRAAQVTPESALGQALARLTADLQEDSFGALIGDLAAERSRLRRLLDQHGGLDGTAGAVCRLLGVAEDEDNESLLGAAVDDRTLDLAGLRRACRALAAGSATDQERGLGLAHWLAGAAADRAAGFAAYTELFLTKDEGRPRKTLITKKAAAADPVAAEALAVEAERLAEVAVRRRAVAVATATRALLTVAEAMLEHYRALKEARALLDYDDLILAARDLLARPGVAPWVLFKLDGGLDHILIDEAQDTNPEQWQVVARLAEEFFSGLSARSQPGDPVRTVFAVGDEKQSIFSFQRADPREFVRMRGHFQERVTAAARGWRQVRLDISFRSVAAVLSTVDRVFAGDAARDGVALDPAEPVRHFAHRRGQGGLVELWPAVAPEPRPEPEPWLPPLTREPADQPSARLAAALASTIRGWLDRGERLVSRGRPIRPGDIMVLVRRRTSFVTELVRALKERGVPVAGVDRMVLNAQLSVMDLTALAQVLLLREDDLQLAIVLKGPLIGFDDDRLFALAYDRPGSLWRALAERAEREPDSAYGAAHGWLAALMERVDFVQPFELFASVLHRPCPADPVSGWRAMLGRLGDEARDPIDEFLSLCLSYQRSHPPSLQGLWHWLGASRAEIKRELEQGGGPAGSHLSGGVVRIMTVHGAKGLQAPVVIMPDTMGKPVRSPRILWPEQGRTVPLYAPRRNQEEAVCQAARAASDQRRDQEYRRLLYVALTRAEDRLYICGWQGKTRPPDGSWYQLVETALAGDDRVSRFDFAVSGAGGWSGEGLRLVEPQTAPAETPPVPALAALLTAPPAWALAPAPVEPEPSRPLTPSRPDEAEPAVRSPLGGDDGSRFRRGLLLHQLFQTLPSLDPAVRAAAARRHLARPTHGLSPAVQDELVAEVMAVLNHAEFAPLFGPGSRAEVPVVGSVGGRVLSGQIDRLLVTGDQVWIVDYKTNRPPPATVAGVAPLYLRQLACYRAAVRQLYPGRQVRCLLLWTDGPRLMDLPDTVLDGIAGSA